MNTEREPTAKGEFERAAGTELAAPAESSEAQREEVATRLRRLDRLADLLDDQFEIPFTDRRIGIDPILGVIPGGGDWAAAIAGFYILWSAARLDAPPRLLLAMGGHLTIDLLGGYVPLAGDLFDAAYKSNRKNVDLLVEHFDYAPGRGGGGTLPDTIPSSSQSPWRRYLFAAALIAFLAVLAAGPFLLLWWAFGG